MDQEQSEPNGYQEIGRTLAQPVAEGMRGIKWAYELAKLLGYTTSDVAAWIEHYQTENAEELRKMEFERRRKQRKIERWRRKSKELKGHSPRG